MQPASAPEPSDDERAVKAGSSVNRRLLDDDDTAATCSTRSTADSESQAVAGPSRVRDAEGDETEEKADVVDADVLEMCRALEENISKKQGGNELSRVNVRSILHVSWFCNIDTRNGKGYTPKCWNWFG